MRINIDAKDKLLVEDKDLLINALEKRINKFVLEGANPREAVISIQSNQGSSYDRYVQVLDITKSVYQQIWNKEAVAKYGRLYSALPKEAQKEVRKYYPLVISEPKLFKQTIK